MEGAGRRHLSRRTLYLVSANRAATIQNAEVFDVQLDQWHGPEHDLDEMVARADQHEAPLRMLAPETKARRKRMNVEMLEQRLTVLRQEYEAGQSQLRALEQREADLRNTMLRISGAITVLEEMLAEERAIGE